MRRYLGIGVAWLGATALSVVIASAAVAGIRDGVVDTPAALGAPTTSTTAAPTGSTLPVVESTSASEPSTTTAPQASTTTTEAAPTTTTVVESSTTSEAPPATTTTSAPTTTQPPSTTTTAAPSVSYQTYNLIGGSVTLAVGDGEVSVASVSTNLGFSPEIEKNGPREVEVKFESDDHKSELSAKFDNGELKVEVEEEPHDGDDD